MKLHPRVLTELTEKVHQTHSPINESDEIPALKAAVQAGADYVSSQAAKWIAVNCPSMHDAYLKEFRR